MAIDLEGFHKLEKAANKLPFPSNKWLIGRLGRVKGNKMVDMQLSNIKLVARAVNMVMQATKLDEKTAQSLLNQYGSVRKAVENAPSKFKS